MNSHKEFSSVPDYLYHYTSIEALACILKDQTLRLSALTNMDDLFEGQTAESSTLASFVCVSSWTEDTVESIPSWREYASLKGGVRIRLKTNPFTKYFFTDEETLVIKNAKLGINTNVEMLLPYNILYSLKYIPMPINCELLMRVDYTDDENLTRPKIAEYCEGGATVAFGRLGLHKRTAWRHQREWRYRVLITPINLFEFKTEDVDLDAFNIEIGRRYGRLSPTSFVHLTIRDDAFSEMQITTSPGISAGNMILVDLLKEKYNPSMQITKSSLEGALR